MAITDQSTDAYRRLIGMGYSPAAAAGIVGNLVQESGGRLNTRAVHDKGTGYGIAGWRDPTPGRGRKTDLFNFARSRNLDVDDIGTQLAFLDHELKTKERGVYEKLVAAKTPDDAALAFIGFERPAGWSAANPAGGHGWENRRNNARRIAGLEPVAAQNSPAEGFQGMAQPAAGGAPASPVAPGPTPPAAETPPGLLDRLGGGEGKASPMALLAMLDQQPSDAALKQHMEAANQAAALRAAWARQNGWGA